MSAQVSGRFRSPAPTSPRASLEVRGSRPVACASTQLRRVLVEHAVDSAPAVGRQRVEQRATRRTRRPRRARARPATSSPVRIPPSTYTSAAPPTAARDRLGQARGGGDGPVELAAAVVGDPHRAWHPPPRIDGRRRGAARPSPRPAARSARASQPMSCGAEVRRLLATSGSRPSCGRVEVGPRSSRGRRPPRRRRRRAAVAWCPSTGVSDGEHDGLRARPRRPRSSSGTVQRRGPRRGRPAATSARRSPRCRRTASRRCSTRTISDAGGGRGRAIATSPVGVRRPAAGSSARPRRDVAVGARAGWRRVSTVRDVAQHARAEPDRAARRRLASRGGDPVAGALRRRTRNTARAGRLAGPRLELRPASAVRVHRSADLDAGEVLLAAAQHQPASRRSGRRRSGPSSGSSTRTLLR